MTPVVYCNEPAHVILWTTKVHTQNGNFLWSPSCIRLFLSELQEEGKEISGEALREVLKKKRPHNANMLDFLLSNQTRIPDEYKDKCVFFWGTEFSNQFGISVKCLYFSKKRGRYRWDHRLTSDTFGKNDYSALLT